MDEGQVDVLNEVNTSLGVLHVLGSEAGLGESLREGNQAQTISEVLGEIGDRHVLRDVTISPEGECLER